jgi:hypothetical protein
MTPKQDKPLDFLRVHHVLRVSIVFGGLIHLVARVSVLIMVTPPLPGYAQSVEAAFRGCDVSGWCRFRMDSPHPSGQTDLFLRPEGIPQPTSDQAMAIALRDRLNALLSNMIHQAKRIELHALRELDDGTYTASVTVHGVDVASDPVIAELRAKKIRRPGPPD